MERSIRIGKDFNVRWSIHRVEDGERRPYELAGKELVLQYRTPYGLKEATEWKTEGNTIVWTFRGKEQKALGSHELILTENSGKDGMVTVDACRAFKLVAHSCEETEGSGSDIVIEDVVLESEVAFAPIIKEGGEPYDDTELKKSIADLQAKDKATDAKLTELSEKVNELGKGEKPIVSVTYAELVALRDNGELIAGMQYRITDYVTTTAQENTRSAGNQFDIMVTADNANTLNEVARACLHEGDTYFSEAGANLAAWQIWYSLDNDSERFAWADTENGKGVIYRMIDEWNNDCPYDFKNIQFNRGVYDGGGIAPDGDEDMNLHLFTFSFRTEDNEIIDTSIFGNNGRLLNDEWQIMGVYGNIIGQYMMFYYSIESPTKISQRLNDIVFYSHYDYEGGAYYGCYSNIFGNGCYSNIFGNGCSSNSFGNDCSSNSFGNDCSSNIFGNNCSSNIFGNGCSSNIFGNGCHSNIFGNGCHFNSFGNGCYSNSFKDIDGIADNVLYNRLDDGVNYVELYYDDNKGNYSELKNHHICRGVNSRRVEIHRDRDFETIYTMTSDGELREFVFGDLDAS